MAQFSFKDPQHQRAQQRAASKRSMGPSRLARTEIGEISGKHANYQLGRQDLFERLSIQSRLADSQHKYRTTALGIQDKSLDMQARALDDEDKGLNWTIASGLLGTGLGLIEGRRREALLAKDREERKQFRLWLQNSIVPYDPTEEEQ